MKNELTENLECNGNDLLEEIKNCTTLKCLENISHTLTDIHTILIFIKMRDAKIAQFKWLLKENKGKHKIIGFDFE